MIKPAMLFLAIVFLSIRYAYTNENKSMVISRIKINGISTDQHEFITSQLPVRTGDTIELTALNKKLEKHTRQLKYRTDLYNAYGAMVIPPRDGSEDSSSRKILVNVQSRTINTWDGGSAFGFMGNTNRTGRGDQWGIYAGYNKIGGNIDRYFGKQIYLGGAALYLFSMNDLNIETYLSHLTVFLTGRVEHSPILSSLIAVGLWEQRLAKKGDWFGKHKDNYLMFEYNIHIRLESLIEMGTFGATIRPTVWSAFLINKNLKPEFGADIEIWGHSRQYAIFETHAYMCALASSMQIDEIIKRPEGFNYLKTIDNMQDINYYAEFNIQERAISFSRQLGFTKMTASVGPFVEVSFHDKLKRIINDGLTWGPGLFLSFSPPVGVDLQFLVGFDREKCLGFSIMSRTTF